MKINDWTINATSSDRNKKGKVKMGNTDKWAHGLQPEAIQQLQKPSPTKTMSCLSDVRENDWHALVTWLLTLKAASQSKFQRWILKVTKVSRKNQEGPRELPPMPCCFLSVLFSVFLTSCSPLHSSEMPLPPQELCLQQGYQRELEFTVPFIITLKHCQRSFWKPEYRKIRRVRLSVI